MAAILLKNNNDLNATIEDLLSCSDIMVTAVNNRVTTNSTVDSTMSLSELEKLKKELEMATKVLRKHPESLHIKNPIFYLI